MHILSHADRPAGFEKKKQSIKKIFFKQEWISCTHVKGRVVVDLGDGHFLGRPRAPAAAVRHVGQQSGPGLVVRDLRRRRQRPTGLGPVTLLLHISVRGRHRHCGEEEGLSLGSSGLFRTKTVVTGKALLFAGP